MSGENFDQYVTRHALCEIKFSKSYPASRARIDVWRARQPLINYTLRPSAHSGYETQAAWRSTRRGDWLWPHPRPGRSHGDPSLAPHGRSSRRRGNRRLNPQHRPIGAPRVTMALAVVPNRKRGSQAADAHSAADQGYPPAQARVALYSCAAPTLRAARWPL